MMWNGCKKALCSLSLTTQHTICGFPDEGTVSLDTTRFSGPDLDSIEALPVAVPIRA
ncbi:uncharacterized protein PHALS_08841 [Plasmopara halstedii]|uniref:Uncharacterized protein n=1 Tax=Plasmopara halstedii TaxID=4781 RepID=A0A0P1ACY5_PLAHL|nr:uncharacterized protein PHALS_08841 [Plasmopara halstedii]CEG38788.1 hypothetical protein PHALS_08841 [Plasmopara halstedii]|eukprot:XP_024575157.1 hypothetical protein PHALS_08841 [Plasmopara halstedii]